MYEILYDMLDVYNFIYVFMISLFIKMMFLQILLYLLIKSRKNSFTNQFLIWIWMLDSTLDILAHDFYWAQPKMWRA